MPIACAQSIPQRTATTSAMRRFVATRALRAASSSAAQRATRSAPSLAAVRAITTSRARLAGERVRRRMLRTLETALLTAIVTGSASQLTNEGAKASRYGDVWQILKDHVQDRGVNLVGDAAVVVFYVALFGRISYKLMPRCVAVAIARGKQLHTDEFHRSRMQPNVLMSESVQILANNREVLQLPDNISS